MAATNTETKDFLFNTTRSISVSLHLCDIDDVFIDNFKPNYVSL